MMIQPTTTTVPQSPVPAIIILPTVLHNGATTNLHLCIRLHQLTHSVARLRCAWWRRCWALTYVDASTYVKLALEMRDPQWCTNEYRNGTLEGPDPPHEAQCPPCEPPPAAFRFVWFPNSHTAPPVSIGATSPTLWRRVEAVAREAGQLSRRLYEHPFPREACAARELLATADPPRALRELEKLRRHDRVVLRVVAPLPGHAPLSCWYRVQVRRRAPTDTSSSLSRHRRCLYVSRHSADACPQIS